MATIVNCPSCAARLRIPADVRDASLTCPRCLASVANPAMSAPASAPTSTAITTGPMAGEDRREASPETAFTSARAMRDERITQLRAADADVRCDSWVVSLFLLLLAVMGATLSPILLLFLAETNRRGTISGGELGAAFLVTCFMALVWFGIKLQFSRTNPAARGMGRIILSGFALIGALILAGVALLILFVLVCIASLVSGN